MKCEQLYILKYNNIKTHKYIYIQNQKLKIKQYLFQ